MRRELQKAAAHGYGAGRPFRVVSGNDRAPPPWSVEALDGGFKVVDANNQSLAYVCGHADAHDAQIAKGLTLDEARRIASNIAKLPNLLAKKG